jgi:DNA polymerase-3 subunit alpha
VLDSSVKISEYMAECKQMGIAVLPPDVNESDDDFTVVPEGIRFGLAAVKNIGRGFIQKVMEERKNGLFTGLEDFCRRMYGTDLNKRALENLIKCGACDCFRLRRSQMLQISGDVLDSVTNSKRKNVDGQLGLFEGFGEETEAAAVPGVRVPDIPELTAQERMAMEKETTGLYLSGHPMDDYRPLLRGQNIAPLGEILESFENRDGQYEDEQQVSVAGIVQNVKMKTTKNNSMMAYVTLEDDTGAMEMLVFSTALGLYGSYLRENSAIIAQGKLSVREDKDPQMLLNRARPIGELQDGDAAQAEREESGKARTLYLKVASESAPGAKKLLPLLRMFPGKTRTVLYYADTGARRAGACLLDDDLLKELRSLLGEKNVVLK